MKSRLLLLSLLICVAPLHAQPQLPPPINLEENLKKARVNGKYVMLLAQIEAPQHRDQYGDFHDKGLINENDLGLENVTPGYAVYVAPFWYIWRDMLPAKRRWGPEQVIGEPDTNEIGDNPTAWASRGQDNQPEWLLAEFPTVVIAGGIRIYETYNPGAITRITAFALDGKEVEVWAGQAAPITAVAVVINEKEFARPIKTNRIKIYLDSPRVPGWNEIDAIGLVGKDGKTQWASGVACSSSYAEQGAGLPAIAMPKADRLQQLEQQLRQLHNDVNELRQRAGLPVRPLPPDLGENLFAPIDLGGLIFQAQPPADAPPVPVDVPERKR